MADSVAPPALSLSSNTSISHSHIKEQNRAVAIAVAVLCKPLLHHRRQKSYFCIHVQHHSALFDGTDHCQDVQAHSEYTVEPENSIKIYRNAQMAALPRCLVWTMALVTDFDSLIRMD